MSERMGVVLPDVYDGISVWIEPDGTYVNRWAWHVERHPSEPVYRRRFEMAQAWIDERTEATR